MPASNKHLKQLLLKEKANIDLFAKWPENNLYYLVRLIKLDEKKDKCFVSYEDGTECWVNRKDAHLQFSASVFPFGDSDEIFCCLCEKDDSDKPNEIVLCDICQQGFHQECHQPKIRDVDENSSEEWSCHTCSYIMKQMDPMPNTSTPKIKQSRAKKEAASPRRAILKTSQADKQNRIKLSRDNKNDKKVSQEQAKKASQEQAKKASQEQAKKASQERVKTKPAAVPVASESDNSDELVPEDSTDGSPEPPMRDLPKDASLDAGPPKVLAAANALVNNIGTNDFVEAIEQRGETKADQKSELKAKATNGKTNGKIPRKVGAKKPAKVPVVPPA